MTHELSKSSTLHAVLSKHGFSFKKQLGQNFLVDAKILDEIVGAAQVAPEDGVLEIGPGAGVVTQILAQRAKSVVAVEKDKSLKPILDDTMASHPNTHIVFEDILTVDLSALWSEYFQDCARVHIVANLPYYITTPILFHVLESGVDWTRIVIMVQKEVADRLVAPPGKKQYGALTVTVSYYASVQLVTVVPPASFVPPPSVDSTVICLTRHLSPPVDVCNPKLFFRIVKAAFSTRRKTLFNALSGALGISKPVCAAWLEATGIDGVRRGETLNLAEFARLTECSGPFLEH